MATIHVQGSLPCEICEQTNALNYWKRVETIDSTDETYNYYSVCKFCVAKIIKSPEDISSVKKACKAMDMPFIETLWTRAQTITKAKKDSGELPAYSNMTGMTDDERYHIAAFSEYLRISRLKDNMHFFKGGKTYKDSKTRKPKIDIVGDMLEERRKSPADEGSLSADSYNLGPSDEEKEKIKELREIDAAAKYKNQEVEEYEQLFDEYGMIIESRLSEADKFYLVRKWGENYEIEELLRMEEMWIKMCDSYNIATPSHEDYLKKIIKISWAIEGYIKDEDWGTVNTLGNLYDKWMKSAEFTEASRRKDTIEDNVPAICEVLEMVEKVGYIEPFDLSVPKDIVDLTLSNMNAYTKKLVLNETGLGSQIERSIQTMMEIEEQEENDIDDLPDAYDMMEDGIGEPGEVEMIDSANFEDYVEEYEEQVDEAVYSDDFDPSLDLIGDEEEELHDI